MSLAVLQRISLECLSTYQKFCNNARLYTLLEHTYNIQTIFFNGFIYLNHFISIFPHKRFRWLWMISMSQFCLTRKVSAESEAGHLENTNFSALSLQHHEQDEMVLSTVIQSIIHWAQNLVTFAQPCNESVVAGWCRTARLKGKWFNVIGIEWVLLISVTDTQWETRKAGKWPHLAIMCKAPVIESAFHIQVSMPNCPANLIAYASGAQSHYSHKDIAVGLLKKKKKIW